MKSRLLLVVMIIGVFYVDHAAASEASAFTADRAMELLREGNARYVNADPAHPNCGGERRSETASEGQHPFVAVLSCSDSRVPVELVFDRGIGDIFVIRVAGNIAIDRGVIGSAEYAAGHLGVPLLVVMGHTGCGAVKAAISGTPLAGDIGYIQNEIEPIAKGVMVRRPDLKGEELTAEVVRENVRQAREDLISHSEEIRDLAKGGKVRIAIAVYDIASGRVEWLE